MATLTYTTTTQEDAAIAAAADRFNTQQGTSVTPAQYVRRLLDHWIAAAVREHQATEQATRRELYERASAEDKAAIDALLDRYRA